MNKGLNTLEMRGIWGGDVKKKGSSQSEMSRTFMVGQWWLL